MVAFDIIVYDKAKINTQSRSRFTRMENVNLDMPISINAHLLLCCVEKSKKNLQLANSVPHVFPPIINTWINPWSILPPPKPAAISSTPPFFVIISGARWCTMVEPFIRLRRRSLAFIGFSKAARSVCLSSDPSSPVHYAAAHHSHFVKWSLVANFMPWKFLPEARITPKRSEEQLLWVDVD